MNQVQLAVLLDVRESIVNNRCDGESEYAKGVAAANQNMLVRIDHMIELTKQGHTNPVNEAHAPAWPFAAAEAPARGSTFPVDPPRNIIWDSRHPDRPVEWSNPSRAANEGEVHYIRYDLYSDAVHAAPAAPALPAEVREAIKVAREALGKVDTACRLIPEDLEGYLEPLSDALSDARAALARLDALGGVE